MSYLHDVSLAIVDWLDKNSVAEAAFADDL